MLRLFNHLVDLLPQRRSSAAIQLPRPHASKCPLIPRIVPLFLTNLIILSILSVLTWTPIGGLLATVSAITVIGIPITFAIVMLPTITLALWIIFLTRAVTGKAVPGLLIAATLLAVPPFVLAPLAKARAAAFQAQDTGLPELPPQGTLAIASNSRAINHAVLSPLEMGFEAVIITPAREPAQRVTLRRVDGALCEPLAKKLRGNAHTGSQSLLNLTTEDLRTCVTLEPATLDDADVIERVETAHHASALPGTSIYTTRVTYQARSAEGLEEIARATWVRYDTPIWPMITRIESEGIEIKLRPGLYTDRARLAPDRVAAKNGGYVLTQVNPSFGL